MKGQQRSPSTRRAWIEIQKRQPSFRSVCRSPSTRRAWIEISSASAAAGSATSPSTRRAWIEIAVDAIYIKKSYVALHPEGVDRNPALLLRRRRRWVALHPEGVDRNKNECPGEK